MFTKVTKLENKSSQTDETIGRLYAEFTDRERGGPPPADRFSFPIVTLAGGSGASPAVVDILSAWRPAAGIAYVYVHHHATDRIDDLLETLTRDVRIPVLAAEHDMRVEPDRAYVIPARCFLGIVHGIFKILPAPDAPVDFHPVDFFLRCLADDQAQLAIAVILSGEGLDGAEGLRSIRGNGGIAMVQDPASAEVAAMPENAIKLGATDLVLDVADLIAEIKSITTNALASSAMDPLSDGEMALVNVFSQLKRKTGVDFGKYKRNTIARRLRRRMLIRKVANVWDYQRVIVNHQNELDDLYRDFLIGVTSFFRDPRVFDQLKNDVLPRLVRQGADENQPFRFWVPGCSTGEEVFSVAICIIEAQENAGVLRPIQIFGSDTNEVSLDRARAGHYGESIAADVSEVRLRRFFTKVNGGYQVNQSLREMCVFARHDVTIDPPFSKLDGVSCRNLLIYLESAFQRNVISMFAYALNVGGVLVLGASETPGANEAFASADKSARIYLRQETATRSMLNFATPVERSMHPVAHPTRSTADPLHHRDREICRILLERYAPAGVLVNGRMQILQFRGATGDFLEAASGEASLNLFKMARSSINAELRILIKRAGESQEVCRQESIGLRHGDVRREIAIEVIPVRSVTDETLFLVSFESSASDQIEVSPSKRARAKPKDEKVRDLEIELVSVRHHLQSIIRDQDVSNAELQSANEEVLCSNEELQSINEELQTAKEELQSTNEELSTVNDELLHRNELLQHTSNDLMNLLDSVNLPIVMVDQDLRLRRFTPVAERVFNLISSDIGRPITQIRPNVNIPDLRAMVTGAIEAMQTTELEIEDHDGHPYLLRIRPYRTASNQIDGAVILLIRAWRDT